MNKFLITLIFLWMISSSTGFAFTIPDEVWLNDNSTLCISFECDSANPYVMIEGPRSYSIPSTSFTENNGVYSTCEDLQLLQIGDYTATVFCNATNMTKTFSVHMLESNILSLSFDNALKLYRGDEFSILVKLKKDDANLQSLTNTIFRLFLDKDELAITSLYFDGSKKAWSLKSKIGSNCSYGFHDIRVDVEYKGHKISSSCENCINVLPELEIEIIEPSTINEYEITENKLLIIDSKIRYRGNEVSERDITRIEVFLDSSELGKQVSFSDSIWSITTMIPRPMPRVKPYELRIKAIYKETVIGESEPIIFYSTILFKGTLKDAANNPIRASIDVRKAGDVYGYKNVTTDNSGKYKLSLLPGIYDIELSFPDLKARITNVAISTSEDLYPIEPIRYDSFFSDGKTIVLEFNLDFDNALIEIPYSDLDENKIMVYECRNWVFESRSCSGKWKLIDAFVDKERNVVSFNITSLSAFALREGKDLKVIANLEKENYYLGENVMLSGELKDENENPVSNARISYSIGDDGGETITTEDGRFAFGFKAPNKTGEFQVDVKAEKLGYTTNVTLLLKVKEKRSLDIILPSSANIDFGSSKTIGIRIANNGQANLKNISIYVINIPSDWYKLSKNKIDRLNINDEEELKLTIELNMDNCADCKEQYSVGVKAKSNDASVTKNFILNVENIPASKKTGTTITGLVTAIGDLAIRYAYIILIIIVLMLLLKHKKGLRFEREDKRVCFMNTLHVIKKESLGKRYSFQKNRKKGIKRFIG